MIIIEDFLKMEKRPKTIFCDIDGVLFRHRGDITQQHLLNAEDILLDGVKETITSWDRKGYRIILTTGRRESNRKYTEKQLNEAGIFYDYLIMGISGGVRVLINDNKEDSDESTAISVNLKRNEGIKKLIDL